MDIIRDGALDLPDLATLPADGGPDFNRLVFSASPYLLQHARNPVDWHPWGEEAFARATREDKPVLLSVGYSTCHWCHVMAHESFEDAEVASYLNEHFIPVKVDREERPDVDHVYMTVCQAMTGSGGWPLTVFMTPDKRPFYSGTYFPKEDRFGRPGFMRVLRAVHDAWLHERSKLEQSGDELRGMLARAADPAAHPGASATRGEDLLLRADTAFRSAFDSVHGGFGGAPKFPVAHSLSYLLRRWKRTADPELLAMAEATLIAMHRGGMYDHVGGGFCRYSTDARWLVPHFEKMLYDNALLIHAYADAYQATAKEEHAAVIRDVFEYLVRVHASPDGAFTCAENADSEGEEGRFYVFTHAEFHEAVQSPHAVALAEYFGVTEAGNFEHGTSVLSIAVDPAEWRARHGFTDDESARILSDARMQLYTFRAARIHPSLDTKRLTSWNGLLIAALAHAGFVLDDAAMTDAARRAADWALGAMRTGDGRLLHCSGGAAIRGLLEDYAFLIWGLIELYQSVFDDRYLATAIELCEVMISDFGDAAGAGFFMSAEAAADLPVRMKDSYDGALPSGNSAAAWSLLRLARLTGRTDFEQRASEIIEAFSPQIDMAPTGHSVMLTALDFAMGPSQEIVLAGRDAADVSGFTNKLRAEFLPHAVVVFHPAGEAGEGIRALAPYVAGQIPVDGKAAKYVCEGFVCRRPTTVP